MYILYCITACATSYPAYFMGLIKAPYPDFVVVVNEDATLGRRGLQTAPRREAGIVRPTMAAEPAAGHQENRQGTFSACNHCTVLRPTSGGVHR